MKIYVTGDLRSEPIRGYIDKLASLLARKGHRCLVPHRDVPIPGNAGPERGLLRRGQHKTLGEFVLEEDLRLLEQCEVAVFVLDGLCWGTSVELGYALALKNRENQKLQIVGIYTDPRGIEWLDVIRHSACDTVVTSLNEVAKLF